jgi:[methyl-Co(III) methanol-specific corrinoid protein]:coenzyme M methyltransferase
MDMIERFEQAIELKEVDRVPLVSPLQTGIVDLMEMTGSYWPDAHKDPNKMANLSIAAYKIGGLESVRVPYENCVEVEALGCVLGNWKVDEQPRVEKHVISSSTEMDKLRMPDPKKDGRMPVVIEAVRILKEKVGHEVPVFAAISSPFEMLARLMDYTQLLREVFSGAEDLHSLLEFATEVETLYAQHLIDAGATGITLVNGSSSNLGPKFYNEYSLKYEKQLIASLDAYTCIHICGDTTLILDLMAQSGTDGISIDSHVPISKAKEIVGTRAAIIGNVSTTNLWKNNPEEIINEAKSCIEDGVDILAPACGFPPRTPLENMQAMKDAVL